MRNLSRGNLGVALAGAIPLLVLSAAGLWWGGSQAAAQRPGRTGPSAPANPGGPLWTMSTPLDDGRQLLLVLDQEQRTVAVYHLDPATGSLTLKSTRDIRWDLLVGDFNAQEPKPSALQKMLEMPK
ncbi:MAG: hypothetical protein RLZZ111_2370 [Planctomycetota bacterium]|jgi:hypothetical protein